MSFKKINNITGWIVGLIACTTYILTREASGSFWDCGEFVSSAYKVQNPHPPGAPLFVLLGRFFIILFGDNPDAAARAVNLMSALASGLTILFLFWTITHFARKIYVKTGEELTSQQIFTVMAAGVVGALAYCFSDSFWFSAVEGEVYGLSSFFTALVFWAMLKWEHADEKAGNDQGEKNRADRWIVFLFFMMGLSIGVHLLNLLTIPAIVMIYYYRRYKSTTKGAITAFIIGCILTGVVQVAVIQWSIKLAGKFDILFVNNFHLPFFSGFIFFFVLLAVLIWLGIRVANRKGWSFLRLGLWCFTFMMMGYSTYVTSLIRSNANPAIDMNNVDNPMNLVYWLSREQYGSQPIVYGPHFAAQFKEDPDRPGYIATKEGEMKYVKGKDKYIPIGVDRDYVYDDKDMQLFPRVWDRSNDQGHADFYISWLDLNHYPPDTDPDDLTQFPPGSNNTIRKPGFKDNVEWFFSYQMGLMYWRYFMWNFAGKQNDIQGLGNKRDGNWITGLSFIDNKRLGDQDMMPESIQKNKAHNKLYLLPFILGVVGFVFQYFKNRKDWIVTFLLFFFTGIAIVIYLNQPGNQPRERDYAYVGSFYAFAIWIGLSVVGFVKMARETEEKQTLLNTLTYGAILSLLVGLMSSSPSAFGDALFSSLMIGITYALVTAVIIYLVRGASAGGKNAMAANIVAAALCVITPIIMAQQEWNDHDRSKKTLAADIAKDYLESCAKNAIIFTFGDNDTYPLWYAQEVEGVRPDIRIINTSLLGIDWYINQLRYKINQSDSLDVMFTPDQIEGHKREYLQYSPDKSIDQNVYYDLHDAMKAFADDRYLQTFPVKKFKINVDTALVRQNGTVNPGDTIVPVMPIELGPNKNDLTRSDLIMLSIIAANNFKRPIYFTSPYGELGFGAYLRKDGISYRLVPVKNKFPQQNWLVDQAFRQVGLGGTPIRDDNEDVMYKNLMEKFGSGGANRNGVYFDEENRRHLLNLRSAYGELAGNLADEGRKEDAKKVLGKFESMVNLDNFPYALVSRYNQHNQTALLYLEACYKAGDTALAEKVDMAVRKDLEQQKKYYDYLRTNRESLYSSLSIEDQINSLMLSVLDQLEKKYGKTGSAANKENGGSVINSLPADQKDSSTGKDSTNK
ncbi:MAG TPA: DUF2723 domain-containing protein [Chitinophagaceae bacterium]|jgi:hypothetical protein|nr:DUF2723 domain-containing protein [Chitinophagaceae bacterium]